VNFTCLNGVWASVGQVELPQSRTHLFHFASFFSTCFSDVKPQVNVTWSSSVQVTGNLSVPVQTTLEVQSALVVQGDLSIGAQSTFVVSNSSANANGTSSQVLIQGKAICVLDIEGERVLIPDRHM